MVHSNDEKKGSEANMDVLVALIEKLGDDIAAGVCPVMGTLAQIVEDSTKSEVDAISTEGGA